VVEAGLLWQLERQAKQLTYHLTLCGAANPLGKIEGDNGEIPRNRLMLLTLLRFDATPRTSPSPSPSTTCPFLWQDNAKTNNNHRAWLPNAKQRRACRKINIVDKYIRIWAGLGCAKFTAIKNGLLVFEINMAIYDYHWSEQLNKQLTKYMGISYLLYS